MHLYATSKMLNLFAATGRRNYAKSARLYVQQMNELEYTHPWLYKQFMMGHFSVKRSNNLWAGIWSDLTIEQTLMRCIHILAGLTRGRGVTESVRNKWVLSMSCTALVLSDMMELTNTQTEGSEQHKELGVSRV